MGNWALGGWSMDEEPEPAVATFDQKYTSDDGAQVEVIDITHGRVTRKDKEDLADDKVGTPYVQFEVRIRNGSKKPLKDISNTFTVTYGPDGEEAEANLLPQRRRCRHRRHDPAGQVQDRLGHLRHPD